MTQPIPLTATRFTPNPSAAILTESEQCEQSRENEWLLEIRVRPEDVAGFKQDYEAIAETWPSDLRTTRDAVALEDFVIDAAALVQKWLPRDVLRRVTKFNSDASQPSALVIRGLPIDDDLPPTTAEGAQIKVGKYMSETWLAGIGRVIGQPFNLRFGPMESLKTGGLGMLFKDILPVLSEEEKVSQNGSAAYLDLHCDYFQCVQECWVHTLAFIGIRGDPQLAGRTLLADFREIYKRANSADIELLRAKPITWRFGPRPEQWFSQLIIDGSDDNPHIYLFDEMVDNFHQVKDLVSGDPDVVAAYRRMKVLGRDLALEHGGVRLEGGDVLLLNQRRVAHGRNGFEAKYDGNDRWLQKLYVNEGQIWQPHGHSPWPERVLPYVVRKTSSLHRHRTRYVFENTL
ncbi:hypothetical protein AXG93_2820s1060 [Marchantia polymorpha subsp. ruderalis]|uniref:TauD/TfdA-like domain-containing protein n=1 Tax=Marchantia polymorpha subsp. ruderalis TaxID=1480154 RepID=A0A176VYM3_MARPO|nr:hypothetical protein AXG93_2820s1060 [Marchantia polymorpha subsp. ruderalis]